MILILVLAAVTLGVIGGSDAAERASAASSDLQIAVDFEHAPLGVYDQAQARAEATRAATRTRPAATVAPRPQPLTHRPAFRSFRQHRESGRPPPGQNPSPGNV